MDPSAASGVRQELAAVGSDRIGLIQGIIEEEMVFGPSGVVSLLTFAAPYARRLCIVSESAYSTYLKLYGAWEGVIAWQGHLIYQGIVQHWPERTSAVIFRSYIDPGKASG